MSEKYILTDQTMVWRKRLLYRIKAIRDFDNVKAGDLGGWVESTKNLSQKGRCWIFQEAKVYDNARVTDDALVLNKTIIFDAARISDNAVVSGSASVYDFAIVSGRAKVSDEAMIYDKAVVTETAMVWDQAEVHGKARIFGHAFIEDQASVFGKARVCGTASVFEHAMVYGEALVSSSADVHNNAKIASTATIASDRDYIILGPIGSRDDYTTFAKGANGDILVSCGCFSGTLSEFRAAVNKKHPTGSRCSCEYLYSIEYAERMLSIH